MTGLVPADAVTVAAGGAAEIGSAVLTVLGAVSTVLYYAALVFGSLFMLYLAFLVLELAAGRRYDRRHPVVPPVGGEVPAGICPCCIAEPYKVDDCTCREDCGAYWCQMAEAAGAAEAVGRPECPWCDTHGCIDRTLCNCKRPCGSWLCEKQEMRHG